MDLLDKLKAAAAAPGPIIREFDPPDFPPYVTPYACTYHWFRDPEGRILGLDLIRSDDVGQLGLRVVRERPEGGFDGLIFGAPRGEWAGFLGQAGESLDASPPGGPLLIRRRGAIAGRCAQGFGGLREVRFDLSVEALAPGLGTGALGLEVSCLTAIDFPRVRYRGDVEIDGVRSSIDALGSVSVHYGQRLPTYAYLATVRRRGETHPKELLAAALRDDAALLLDERLAGRTLVYAYGHGGLPPVSLHVGEFGRSLPLGPGGQIELSEVRPLVHELLGEPTWTATATARHLPLLGEPSELGRIVLDCRGVAFLEALSEARA